MKWLILACCLVLACTACHRDADCRCRHDGFHTGHVFDFVTGTCDKATSKCACPSKYHLVLDSPIGKRDSDDCGGACVGEHCHCGHGACHGTCSKRALMYRREERDSDDCGGACVGEHCHCGHGACHGTCSKRARDTSDCGGACKGVLCHCGHGVCHGTCSKRRDSGDCDGACVGEHCHCGHGLCHGTCSKRALMYRRETTVCDPPCESGYKCHANHNGAECVKHH